LEKEFEIKNYHYQGKLLVTEFEPTAIHVIKKITMLILMLQTVQFLVVPVKI